MNTQPLILAGAIALALSGVAIADQHKKEMTTDSGAKVTIIKGDEATSTDQAKTQDADTAAMDSSSSPYDLRASDIIGREVRNSQDEEVGEVDDLIVSNQDDVVKAVIAVGGFLGMGEHLVAVPYDELQVDVTQDYVMYDVTKEQLESQPEFKYKEGETRWWTNEENRQSRGAQQSAVDPEELQEERQEVMEEREETQEEMQDVKEMKQGG